MLRMVMMLTTVLTGCVQQVPETAEQERTRSEAVSATDDLPGVALDGVPARYQGMWWSNLISGPRGDNPQMYPYAEPIGFARQWEVSLVATGPGTRVVYARGMSTGTLLLLQDGTAVGVSPWPGVHNKGLVQVWSSWMATNERELGRIQIEVRR